MSTIKAFYYYPTFMDAVDDALISGSNPADVATDPGLLAEWRLMAPAETWLFVVERAFYNRELRLPQGWEGEGTNLALALHRDAQTAESFHDWEVTMAMPTQEVQLAMLALYTTAARWWTTKT